MSALTSPGLTQQEIAMRNVHLFVGLMVISVCGFCQAQTTRPVAPSDEEVRLNAKTLAGLDRTLPTVRFDKVGLSDVLDFLSDVSGVRVVPPWDKLKALGIDRNKAMTLNVRDAKFGDVLSVLLIQAAGKPGVLGYTIEHGKIVIVVKEGATTQPK
jgi:hypothetical protein